MTIEYKNSCGICSTGKFSASTRNQIGKTVISITHLDSGHDKTAYSFHQCHNCGVIWRQVIDSGAGGNGKYLLKLDCF